MIISKWKHASSLFRGLDHRQNGMPCQDNVYYLNENGIHVLALSDGAGSKQYSQFGAELVTKEICNYMVKEFDLLMLNSERYGKSASEINDNHILVRDSIFNHIKKCLIQKADDLKIPLEELACTLLFVAIKEDKYIMGHIGDGVIGGLFGKNKNQMLKVLSHPENGEQINITFFLTDPGSNDHFRVSVGKFTALTGIVLMSDGPEEALYHPSNGLDNKIQILFNNCDKYSSSSYQKVLDKFLSTQITKFSYDDLSMNILYLSQIDTATASKEMVSDLFSDINNPEEQIVKQSSYAIFLDNSKNYNIDNEFIHEELMKKYYDEEK